MKYSIRGPYRQNRRENLSVTQLKIDYELMTLYDAMQAKESVQIEKSKENLRRLRLKMLAYRKDI